MISYDRPTGATLHVKLDNGETWEATPEDLERFGYGRRLDAYAIFDDYVSKALLDAGLIRRDITDAKINPLRYIVELAICRPELLSHPEVTKTTADIVAIERHLQATLPEEN
jgi:hypothetical protein